MTREESIERLKMILEEVATDEDAVCYVTSDDADALDMAIKALEQTSVLDKIRTEIVQIPTISFNVNDIYKADVLAIIDKYKAEMEE